MQNVSTLEIVNGSIAGIEKDTFYDLRVTKLDMTGNRIKQFQHGTFERLITLRTLILSNNLINLITSRDFEGLSYLMELYLDSNNILV